MRKRFIFTIFIPLCILLMSVSFITYSSLIINSAPIKHYLLKTIKTNSPYPIDIYGDISIHLFPWLGIELTDVQLKKNLSNDESPFLSLKKIDVWFELIPLLQKKIMIKQVTFDQPRLTLIKDSSGTWNFQSNQLPSNQIPTQQDQNQNQYYFLSFGKMIVKDCELVIKDDQTGHQLHLVNLNFHRDGIVNRMFSLSFGYIAEPKNYTVSRLVGFFDMKGFSTFKPIEHIFQVETSTINMTYELNKNNKSVQGTITGDLFFDFINGAFKLNEMHLTYSSLDLLGYVYANQLYDMPELNLNIRLKKYDITRLEKIISHKIPMTGIVKSYFKAQAKGKNIHQLLQNVHASLYSEITKGKILAQLPQSIPPTLKKANTFSKAYASIDIMPIQQSDSDHLNQNIPYDYSFELNYTPVEPKCEIMINSSGNFIYNYPFNGLSISNATIQSKLFLPDETISSSMKVDYQSHSRTMLLDPIRIKGSGLSVSGKIKMNDILQYQTIQGAVHIEPFNPRQMLSQLGITSFDMKNQSIMNSGEILTDISLTPQTIQLSNIIVMVDDKKMTGKVHVDMNTDPDPFHVTFDLDINELDLDRYWPTYQSQSTSGESIFKSPPVISGTLSMGHFKLYNVSLNQITTKILFKNNELSIDDIQCYFYKGHYSGNMHYNFNLSPVFSSYDILIKQFSIQEYLTDYYGWALLSGKANARMDLTANGFQWKSFMQSLNGTLSMFIKNGEIRGVQVIPNSIRNQLKTLYTKKSLKQIPKKQKFKTLTATGIVVNGVVSCSNLNIKGKLYKINGVGFADMSDREIDAHVKVDVVGLPKVPYVIQGPFQDLSVQWDSSEFFSDAVSYFIIKTEGLGSKAIKNTIEFSSNKLKDTVNMSGKMFHVETDHIQESIDKGSDAIQESIDKGSTTFNKTVKNGKSALKKTLDAGSNAIESIGNGIKGLFNKSKNCDR